MPGPVFRRVPGRPACTTRRSYASGTRQAAPQGKSIVRTRVMRAYLNYQARRLFAGADVHATSNRSEKYGRIACRRRAMSSTRAVRNESPEAEATAARRRQPGARRGATGGGRCGSGRTHRRYRFTCRAWREGLWVRIASPCTGGTSDRKALREADLLVLAGVPSDFRLDYGQHVRRKSTRA